MPYRLELRPDARRQLEKLDRRIRERIALLIESLVENPRPRGTTKLAGYERRYRQRVGDYRIVYDVWDDARLVLVEAIRHRRDVYRP